MWVIIAQRFSTQFVKYATLPVAIVVGSIGYYVEGKLRKELQPLPYLESGLSDQRISRQIIEERQSDFTNYEGLTAEKLKIMPKSSLELNTSRSSSQ